MASRRSTTGCSSCKAKRKKCDETKPRCKRCVTSGSSCSYEFVEYPDHQSHRKRRTRPAPRAISELAARASRHDPVDLLTVNIDPLSVASTSAVGFVHPILSATWGAGNFLDSNLTAPWDAVDPLSLSASSSDPSLPVALDPILDPIDASQTSPNLDLQPTGVPAVWDVATVSSTGSPSRGLSWIGQEEEEEENEDDSYDIEGVQVIICSSPCLDRNVQENSLPFVLHCYSQWTITRIFEPRAIADSVRDQVIEQFSAEHTRKKTILIANVMITFAKNLTIDSARMAILDYLVTEARQCGSRFMATPISVPALDRQNAMRTLDSIFEILTLQTHTQPTATCIRTLDYAAPVFRRACSEPPGKLINLPKLLMETSLNLRHFASVDVMQSVTTGRPMYFQYEVPFSLELCERMYRLQKDQGSQWLYGLPDQFIILIAWINYMSATSADSDTNPELVAWVEQQIPHIKVNTSESGDLLLRIGRMVVLECWRFAVFIYLYMVLGRADARDPRVVRAHKGFMRLVRGVKPGRIPDAFLVCPAIVAGVSAIEQKDRATLCKRILNVRECSEAGTAVSEVVLELEDVWTRTRDEGRAAVWSDLRTAVFRVTGR